MLSAVDEGIKNVTDALEAKGLLNNTLIIFTSDNGGPTTTGDGVGSRNWPLRGGKHSVWEGGTRVTGFINGPMLKKNNYTLEHMMHGADWFPTICEAVGIDTNGTLPLDGVSQWKAINEGNDAPYARSNFVYGNSTNDCSWKEEENAIPCGFAIRNDHYKLTLGYGGGPDTWCNKSSHGNECWKPEDYTNITTRT